ncbi:DUF2059 domain-containing protein [Sphingopyxis sp. PAMC25046]|uniref:DUF2059 domain-containing protein n=1 Tax=Sphingopyxis sp. PAMC25046 TaxID=2565556 RepID=UPI00109DC9B5|nr:DUF2059 domain-containing protein [Sphingopyxis sp. PAMC25046]QCB53910.1 DUF2059 domain-containing protein [Sphingopyxis sp. PAMC25046]
MMPSFKSILLAGAVAMLPLGISAHAAQQEAPEAEVVAAEDGSEMPFDSEAAAAEAKAKMQKEMDEAIALIEKMFDTSDLPPIDPARLTLAQQTTAALIPAGSIEKMVDNLYGKMFKTIMGEFGGQSDLLLSIKTGVETDQIAKLDEATKGKVADMFDPHRKERDEQINRVIKPLISEVLADMEPPMREGLAKAYARKFTGAQLTDLNTFLATPTGNLYASEWMALQADPEVMVAVIKAVPPLVTKFIDRAPEIEKDLKELPKEKQLSDFDDKELGKLAKLMKVDMSVLKEQRDMWNSPAEDAAMTDVAEAADDYAVDAAADVATAEAAADAAVAVEATAYDRSNWSEADRKRVEELEAAYIEAEAAAVEKARERLDKTPSE